MQEHDKIHGSKNNGYGEIRICLYDFRRGTNGTKQYRALPKKLKDFDESDIADLCNISFHCRESLEEVEQLIFLAKSYDSRVRRVSQYCGDRCLNPLQLQFQFNN